MQQYCVTTLHTHQKARLSDRYTSISKVLPSRFNRLYTVHTSSSHYGRYSLVERTLTLKFGCLEIVGYRCQSGVVLWWPEELVCKLRTGSRAHSYYSFYAFSLPLRLRFHLRLLSHYRLSQFTLTLTLNAVPCISNRFRMPDAGRNHLGYHSPKTLTCYIGIDVTASNMSCSPMLTLMDLIVLQFPV